MHPYLRKHRKLLSGWIRIGFWIALFFAGQIAASWRVLIGWGFSGIVSRILGVIVLVYAFGAGTGTPFPFNEFAGWIVIALMVSWATDDARFLLNAWNARRRAPDDSQDRSDVR